MPQALGKNRFYTVLLVDPHGLFARALELFMESRGHFILKVQTAEQALAKTRRFQPDLILVDGDLDGLPVTDLLQGLLLEKSDAAVILLSKQPSIKEAVEAMRLGAADYLERPLDVENLKRAVDFERAQQQRLQADSIQEKLSAIWQRSKMAARESLSRDSLRDLWVGHTFWIRNFELESFAGNGAALQSAEKKMEENCRAIADSLAPYYSPEDVERFHTLLDRHEYAIKAYLKAVREENGRGLEEAQREVPSNSTDIADFLGGLNPAWKTPEFRDLIQQHGLCHMDQIRALKDGDYSREASIWDVKRQVVLKLADAMAEGLARQFPQKFKEP
jgi:ActR/RegA family two-component response regulator